MIYIELLTAILGSLGFALLFNVGKKYLIYAALGGFVCWGSYLLFSGTGTELFYVCLFSAAASTLYSEIVARVLKAPTTVFLIPSVVPLIPGSALYYAMYNAVSGDWGLFKNFGFKTATVAFAMAAGISLVSAVFAVLSKIRKKKIRAGR